MNINLSSARICVGAYSWKRMGASFLILGMVAGCSSVPDAINPIEWYRGAVDAFFDDETETAEVTTSEETGSTASDDEDFPSLSSVPERPSVEDGDAVADGLIADPNAPQYVSSIALQSSDDGTLTVASQDVNTGDQQPPPPAQPAIAVESQTIDQAVEVTTSEVIATPPPPEPTTSQTGGGDTMGDTIIVETTSSDTTSVMITSPPLVVEPGRLPSGETYEEYQARLMAQLEQKGTPSATTILTRNNAAVSYSNETIVISSNGVQDSQQYAGAAGLSSLPSVGLSSLSSTGMYSQAGFLQIDYANGQPLLAPGSVKIATIHFNNGSSGLNQRDRLVLQKVAALQQQQGGVIRVIGHASSRTRAMDPLQHKMVNYNVSVARADNIAHELVRMGAAKNQIMVGAVSDSMPIYYEVMPSGEAGNRRAEIYIDS